MKHFYASQHMTNIDIVPAINTCMNNLKLLRANPSIALTFKTDAYGTILDDGLIDVIKKQMDDYRWKGKSNEK